MTTEKFNELVKAFFKAVKERTLLVIIDSASRNYKAVFSLVSFKKKNDPSYGYIDYANMLKELGFKNYRDERSKFINYCAGRYSLYILDSIEEALRNRGVKIPKGWYDQVQYQNTI